MIDWNDDRSVVQGVYPECISTDGGVWSHIPKVVHGAPPRLGDDCEDARAHHPSVAALDEAHRKVVERWPNCTAIRHGTLGWVIALQSSWVWPMPDYTGWQPTEAAAWLYAASKLTLPSPTKSPQNSVDVVRGKYPGAWQNSTGNVFDGEGNSLLGTSWDHAAAVVSALPSLKEEPAGVISEKPWAMETMRLINTLTPGVADKAFDPDWFLLRQRLEAHECELNRLRAALGEGKWISVDNELPNDVFNVIVWIPNQSPRGGYWDLASYGEWFCEDEDCRPGDTNYVEDNDEGNRRGFGWHRTEDTHGGPYDQVTIDLNGKVRDWCKLPAPPVIELRSAPEGESK